MAYARMASHAACLLRTGMQNAVDKFEVTAQAVVLQLSRIHLADADRLFEILQREL